MLMKMLVICALFLLNPYVGRAVNEPLKTVPTKLDSTEIVENSGCTILLLPLDSRPANTYSPMMVAKASGLEMIMPSSEALDLYKKLGDIENYPSWLLSVEADYYVISLTQLCYGGLVASRTSDTPLELAKKNLDSLRQLKEKIGDKKIYAFDTIQRLAITSGDGRTSQYYSATYEWAILKDEVENLGYTHRQGELDCLESSIPQDIRDDYLQARKRNHIINSAAIDLVNDGVIDYLILAQDDASTTGLHRAEREILKDKVKDLKLSDQVMIFPGADEVGVVLVSRVITEHYNLKPTFSVFYRGVSGNRWIANLEDVCFAENISRHLDACNATIEEDGLIDLFVVTPGGSSASFVNLINERIEKGKKVVVCDVAITNKADPEFFQMMLNEIDLTRLTGFAGWNTAGNTLGLAVGQGIAALARENVESEKLQEATKAHFEYLLHRFTKDYYYKHLVQYQMEVWARSLGFDPMNLPEHLKSFIEEELDFRLWPHLTSFYNKYFANKEVADYQLGDSADWRLELAWPRFFEIQIRPKISIVESREE
ncbi:MAG: DUF4127 family protein [Firmicutes bacterium]|nr:DUF4127 family protein [Bacillota bacterium]MDD4263952.1 DUF4127 family protein [Bacillota bacterium]MDD4693630.1 DUF4127 family protein [Bacillota bacterium]